MITTTDLAKKFSAVNGDTIPANITRIYGLAITVAVAPISASEDPDVEAWHDEDADEIGIAAGF